MGLLDGILNDSNMPFYMGLLAAGGPSTTKKSFGQGLGEAFQVHQQSRQAELQRQQAEQMNQYRGMQMRQMQGEQVQQEVMRGQLNTFRQSLPAEMQALPDNLLIDVWKQSIKPKEDFTLTSGARRYGADGRLIAEVPIERKAPEGMQYDAQGNLVEIPGYVSMKSKIAAAGRAPSQPAQPYYSPVVDATRGVGTFDHRSGQMRWDQSTPVIKPADSPSLQGQIAGAKEASKTMAEETTKAALDAPRVIDNATQALKYSDELLKHPGFSQAVGKSSMLGIQKIPGTDGKDFMNRLDQLKGGAFLEAFNTLKGGGQITEVEGKKATDAIARMDNATSENEFRAAVKDYQEVIKKGMNRAKMKAKPVAPVQQPQQGGVKFLGFE